MLAYAFMARWEGILEDASQTDKRDESRRDKQKKPGMMLGFLERHSSTLDRH
jgi:hypothetical protein